MTGGTLREKVGIVVITRNRAAELLRTLERLCDLPIDLTVVDNGSEDGTPALVRSRFPSVSLVGLARNVGALGRNIGVETARTPYVAFADDDTWWDHDALVGAVETLDCDPRIAVVSARVVVEPGSRADPAMQSFAMSPLVAPARFPGRRVLGFLAGASMVRREPFRSVGGFHPRYLIGGEETLVAWDLSELGWHLTFRGDLTVHHAPSRSRDARRRRELEARNRLWSFWLRRPARDAIAATSACVRAAKSDVDQRRALVEALRGAGWVARQRRVLSASVVAEIHAVESRRTSTYVWT